MDEEESKTDQDTDDPARVCSDWERTEEVRRETVFDKDLVH